MPRSMRAWRNASWMTALSDLPSALARASVSRARSAGSEMVFFTAVAIATPGSGMNKSYHDGAIGKSSSDPDLFQRGLGEFLDVDAFAGRAAAVFLAGLDGALVVSGGVLRQG